MWVSDNQWDAFLKRHGKSLIFVRIAQVHNIASAAFMPMVTDVISTKCV